MLCFNPIFFCFLISNQKTTGSFGDFLDLRIIWQVVVVCSRPVLRVELIGLGTSTSQSCQSSSEKEPFRVKGGDSETVEMHRIPPWLRPSDRL